MFLKTIVYRLRPTCYAGFMMKMKTLMPDELAALKAFAEQHGRCWKQALRDAWMNASEPGILQALRNDADFGPRGLNAFRFEV